MPRQWTLRESNRAEHHGIVDLHESPLELDLHHLPADDQPPVFVGRFELDLHQLLAAGCVRPEPRGGVGTRIRLRIVHAADGGFYVQARDGGPRQGLPEAYELHRLQMETGGVDSRSVSASLEIEPEFEEKLDRFLEKTGTNADKLMWKLNRSFQRGQFWPWAIVLFDREMAVAGHVVEVRSDPGEVRFSAYSLPSDHSVARDGVPAVSMLFISSKPAAARLAQHSVLFATVWDSLSSLPSNRHWACPVKSPPDAWIADTAQGDAERFMRAFRGLATPPR